MKHTEPSFMTDVDDEDMQKSTILLIDDEVDLLAGLKALLQAEGLDVQAAKSGQEAIEILSEMNTLPDLILLDVQMPEMTGLELLEHLRAAPYWQQIPILMLSAHSDMHVSDELCCGQVRKPFRVEVLLQAIEDCIERYVKGS